MDLIKTVNLSKEFSQNKKSKLIAVDNVNLTIQKGKTYGLVGESGCGKSTLASMIALLKNPSSGKILYNNKDINLFSKIEQKEFRKKVQIVFQNTYDSLNPKMTVEQIIEEPLIIHKIADSKKQRKQLVNEIRTMCALDSSILKKYPKELSGGQRQRVNIAASMILKPEFLILDEAVSNLDVLIQAQILNLLKLMQQSLEVTYLFISHNLSVVSYMSDVIGVMHSGKIIEEASANQILKNPTNEYTKQLFNSAFKL